MTLMPRESFVGSTAAGIVLAASALVFPDSRMPAPKTGYAAVNGLNLYYEIHGTGEPLVLLHGGVGATAGTPRSSREWRRWAQPPRSR